MFDDLTSETLRAARDAAQLLYHHRRELGLDADAIKLDTLTADIAAELENRGKPATPPAQPAPQGLTPAPPRGTPPPGVAARPREPPVPCNHGRGSRTAGAPPHATGGKAGAARPPHHMRTTRP